MMMMMMMQDFVKKEISKCVQIYGIQNAALYWHDFLASKYYSLSFSEWKSIIEFSFNWEKKTTIEHPPEPLS
jgi:hypothetical protein